MLLISVNSTGAIAARNGELEIIEELIKAKAGLNFIDTTGETALMIAVQNLNFDVVNELIKADTEIDLQTKAQLQDLFGFTDLHFAAWSENPTAVKRCT